MKGIYLECMDGLNMGDRTDFKYNIYTDELICKKCQERYESEKIDDHLDFIKEHKCIINRG